MRETHSIVAVALLVSTIACSKGVSPDAAGDGLQPAPATAASALEVGRVRWDGSEHPIGVLRLEPRLEWQLSSNERAQRQTAYQILVATDARLLAAGKADVWDSGKITGSQSVDVVYRGPRLLARQRGVWTVRVWDSRDRPSAYAKPATWEVGPWDEDVEGDWIGRASTPGESVSERERSVTYFRRVFTVPPGFKDARLYATAFGVYELRINGKPVSADVLAPGFTDYQKRVLLQTRDVTALVHDGENVVAGVLAGGWCTARLFGQPGPCGSEPPRLRTTLEVTLADGKLQTLESDDEWKYSPGPWLSAGLLDGESYDARRETPGWDAPGFDDKGWQPAVEYDGDTERNVYADRGAPMRIIADRSAVSVAEPSPKAYVFDLGESIVGWAQLKVQAAAGTDISLRFGQSLRADGTLLTNALTAGDRYVARGGGAETWEPRFSLRRFRYVELRGLPERPSLDTIVGRMVGTDMPPSGSLDTSDQALNRLTASIARASQQSLFSVPMLNADATRMGSQLEAQLFAYTSCLNHDVQRFYRKWIDDLRDAQLPNAAYADQAPLSRGKAGGAFAGTAGVLIPWALYRCYADSSEIGAHVTSMGRFLDLIRAKNPNLIWRNETGADVGDPLESGPPTEHALIATAELSYAADALALMMRASDMGAEAERFTQLARDTRAAFVTEFVHPDGRLDSDTQTAYAVAIARGVLVGDVRARAAAHLIAAVERSQRRPTTGLVGTPLLLPALSQIGRNDLAYAMLRALAQDIEKQPSVAVWALGEWMYDVVGGIALDPAAPAGKHVFIRPRPESGLTHARASFASAYGPIETEWAVDGGSFRLKVRLPVGSSGSVSLPFVGSISEAGQPAPSRPGIKAGEGEGALELESGTYELTAPLR